MLHRNQGGDSFLHRQNSAFLALKPSYNPTETSQSTVCTDNAHLERDLGADLPDICQSRVYDPGLEVLLGDHLRECLSSLHEHVVSDHAGLACKKEF